MPALTLKFIMTAETYFSQKNCTKNTCGQNFKTGDLM